MRASNKGHPLLWQPDSARQHDLLDLVWCLASYLATHAVHGGISADIGQVIARVALRQVGQLVKVDAGLDFHILHTRDVSLGPASEAADSNTHCSGLDRL